MANFVCEYCGMVNIDCGKDGYKTEKELQLEAKLNRAVQQYNAVVAQNRSLQTEIKGLKKKLKEARDGRVL